jgi:asparagine synthase (glutamine-hydrolysing)
MPGLAGLISRRGGRACEHLAAEMTALMQHEKFHVSGSHSAPELGLFAGWVALEGSFAHSQPITNERGDVVLLIAGECFSGQSGNTVLETRGRRREPNSAGWLTDLYEKRGDSFFEELNGIFSGLLIDYRQQKVSLFNDRYGMERVYYHEGRDGFFFASEAKALLRILPDLRSFDDQGLLEFLQYGCTLRCKTLFRDIRILPAASVWTFTAGERCHKHSYFVSAKWESQPALAEDSFTVELERTFAGVLPRYFESEAAIGVSLTGGLDTRMIMACRPAARQDLITYTFAGMAGETLDVRRAAQVAAACGAPHHILRLGHDFFSDFPSLADRTVYVTDGYLSVCGTHEIYLNHQARGLAPVRLTGNFGSEILRGGTTFKPLGVSADLLHPDLRQALSDESFRLTKAASHPVSFSAFTEIPWHLFGLARAAQSQLTTRTPYLDNDLVALAFRAPEQLRRSSTPALRVIRDNHSGLARIRTDSGLLPSSRLSSFLGSLWFRPTFKLDYWRNVGLPNFLSPLDALLSCVPAGHALLPEHRYLHYRRWFRAELADYLRERLSDSRILRSRLWNRRFLEHIAEAHISGRNNYLREIDTVLTCSAIDRLLLGSDV